MSCYGNHPEDQYYERMLNKHLGDYDKEDCTWMFEEERDEEYERWLDCLDDEGDIK